MLEPIEAADQGKERVGSTCTLEQVAAMARAGLTDEQIRGACLDQAN